MRVVWLFATLSLVGLLCACAPMPPASAASGARIVVVQGSINTTASNGAGQGVNIDAVGTLPFGKIKRYTVTLQTALLSTAPAGVDRIEAYVGVLGGASTYDVRVVRQDPATAAPFPHPGMTIPPYTGSNSYITVFRGADGLGPVEVRFNAFVELEP